MEEARVLTRPDDAGRGISRCRRKPPSPPSTPSAISVRVLSSGTYLKDSREGTRRERKSDGGVIAFRARSWALPEIRGKGAGLRPSRYQVSEYPPAVFLRFAIYPPWSIKRFGQDRRNGSNPRYPNFIAGRACVRDTLRYPTWSPCDIPARSYNEHTQSPHS